MDIIEVNDKELAEWLGVSDRRVRQLAESDIVVRTKKGRYNLKESVIRFREFKKEEYENKGASADRLKMSVDAQKLKHEQLKSRKTELQVLQLEKKMHLAEDVEYFWNNMAVAVKGRMRGIPVKIAPQLVGLEDRKEIQAILKREIDDALNEMADYDIDKFESDYDDALEDDE